MSDAAGNAICAGCFHGYRRDHQAQLLDVESKHFFELVNRYGGLIGERPIENSLGLCDHLRVRCWAFFDPRLLNKVMGVWEPIGNYPS